MGNDTNLNVDLPSHVQRFLQILTIIIAHPGTGGRRASIGSVGTSKTNMRRGSLGSSSLQVPVTRIALDKFNVFVFD